MGKIFRPIRYKQILCQKLRLVVDFKKGADFIFLSSPKTALQLH